MPKPMRRFMRNMKSGLNKLLAPAEDPRQAFVYTFERQRGLLSTVQGALVDVGEAKQRLGGKAAEVQSKLPLLKTRARQSLLDGREDLARLALQRYQLVAAELKLLERQLLEIEQEEQRLSLTEQRLSSQLEAFFARQEFIAARYSAAEVQVQIGEALTGVSEELAELSRAMEQTERKSEYMQARAAAIDRLVDDGFLELPGAVGTDDGHLLPADVAQDVEKQLADLKRQLA